jgi:hypothetical protein
MAICQPFAKEEPMNEATFLATTRHLQITFSAEEYCRLVEELDKEKLHLYGIEPVYLRFWRRLPEYRIAECPFCGAHYYEKLDTHSLLYWRVQPFNQSYVFSSDYRRLGCDHFVAVHSFVNLNDTYDNGESLLPLPSFENDSGDIPFVVPDLLPEGFASIATIHSLPICRLETSGFVPRYSLYMITYFAEDVRGLKAYRWRDSKAELGQYPPLLDYPELMRHLPNTADLQDWVAKSRLQWLDPCSPDLALRAEPVADFPYMGITGYGERFTYAPQPIVTPSWAFWRKRKLRAGDHILLRG